MTEPEPAATEECGEDILLPNSQEQSMFVPHDNVQYQTGVLNEAKSNYLASDLTSNALYFVPFHGSSWLHRLLWKPTAPEIQLSLIWLVVWNMTLISIYIYNIFYTYIGNNHPNCPL